MQPAAGHAVAAAWIAAVSSVVPLPTAPLSMTLMVFCDDEMNRAQRRADANSLSPNWSEALRILRNRSLKFSSITCIGNSVQNQKCAYSGRVPSTIAVLEFVETGAEYKVSQNIYCEPMIIQSNILRVYRFAHFLSFMYQKPFGSPAALQKDFLECLVAARAQ